MVHADGDWIARPRLLQAIRNAPPAACVVLEAAAGFGKTVLGTQFLRTVPADGRPAVAVLATAVTDTAELVDRIAAAAGLERPEGGAGVHDAGLTSVLRAIGPGGCVLIDHAQEIAHDHRALLWDCTDDRTARLVVCSRPTNDPSLPRAVMNGRVLLIGEDMLAFTDEEAEAHLSANSIGGPWNTDHWGLTAWPALSTRVAAGEHELVASYLREEILSTLPAGTARLITALSHGEDASEDAITAVSRVLDLPPEVGRSLSCLWSVRAFGHASLLHPCWVAAARDAAEDGDEQRVARALAELEHSRGNTVRAGRLAVLAEDPVLLGSIASDTLMSIAPPVPVEAFDDWLMSGLLTDPMRRFVELTAAVMRGAVAAWVCEGFAECATAWSATDNGREEVMALLQTGLMARKLGDLAAMTRVMERAVTIDDVEVPEVVALRELGHSVRSQLAGDPAAGLEAARRAASLAPAGTWRYECEMMIGGCEVMLQNFARGMAAYERATTTGSDAERALAHRACAFARCDLGDDDRCIEDLESAVKLARRAGNPALVALMVATRECLGVVVGHAEADDRRQFEGPASDPHDPRLGEAALFRTLAQAIRHAERGEIATARALLGGIDDAPLGPTHATGLLCVIQVALGVEMSTPLKALAELHPNFAHAVAAGEAARSHLEGGPLPDPRYHTFLPRMWTTDGPRVTMRLLGGAEIRHMGADSDLPNWARGRVRELCLHLVVVPRANRSQRSSDLWPDLSQDRGAANLRVTLTQLLDVLEPDRAKGEGSGFVESTGTTMTLQSHPGLSVDVWEAEACASRLADALTVHDRTAVLVEARRLTALIRNGTLLAGGLPVEWVEAHQRELDRRMLDALELAGPVALAEGDSSLAERLAACALGIDPWSESSSRLIVDSRLKAGDVDGARRALGHLLERLADLDATPQPATADLVAQLGRPMRRRTDGREATASIR